MFSSLQNTALLKFYNNVFIFRVTLVALLTARLQMGGGMSMVLLALCLPGAATP